MKFELRKIGYLAGNSEETPCYNARVFVDGTHTFDVQNDGRGGCDRQHPAKGFTRKDLDALQARVADEFPPAFVLDGKAFPPDLESVCQGLLFEYLDRRDMTRLFKRVVLFTTEGDLRQAKLKQRGHTFSCAALAKEIRCKYIDAVILNEMDVDDALAIYRNLS